MARKQQGMQEVEKAAAAIGGLLLTAVEATVDEPGPGPSRECVREFLALDHRASPDTEGGPAQLLAMLTLVRRLGLVRDALAEQPDRVETVLAWIEENLGTRFRARARYTAPVLQSEGGAADIASYKPALQDDFLPTMIWLLAGAVAVYGGGEIAWLEGLEAGKPSATSFFTGA